MNRKDYDETKELVKSTTVKFETAGKGFTVKLREKGCVIESNIPSEILTDSMMAAIMILKMALDGLEE